MHGSQGSLHPTYEQCFVQDAHDALLLVQAVIDNKLRAVERRPQDLERPELIKSGNIFIFDEKKGHIQRWTDGISWSPSRILGEFLIYREKKNSPRSSQSTFPKKKHGSSSSNSGLSPDSTRYGGTVSKRSFSPKHRSSSSVFMQQDTSASPIYIGSGVSPSIPPQGSSFSLRNQNNEYNLYGSLTSNEQYKENGLIKKTISVPFKESSYRLISYYFPEDVEKRLLKIPSQDSKFSGISIAPELAETKHMKTNITFGSSNFSEQYYGPYFNMPMGTNHMGDGYGYSNMAYTYPPRFQSESVTPHQQQPHIDNVDMYYGTPQPAYPQQFSQPNPRNMAVYDINPMSSRAGEPSNSGGRSIPEESAAGSGDRIISETPNLYMNSPYYSSLRSGNRSDNSGSPHDLSSGGNKYYPKLVPKRRRSIVNQALQGNTPNSPQHLHDSVKSPSSSISMVPGNSTSWTSSQTSTSTTRQSEPSPSTLGSISANPNQRKYSVSGQGYSAIPGYSILPGRYDPSASFPMINQEQTSEDAMSFLGHNGKSIPTNPNESNRLSKTSESSTDIFPSLVESPEALDRSIGYSNGIPISVIAHDTNQFQQSFPSSSSNVFDLQPDNGYSPQSLLEAERRCNEGNANTTSSQQQHKQLRRHVYVPMETAATSYDTHGF